MRRGLMGWNAEELPLRVLTLRLVRLRGAMKTSGLDALVLYTNNVRPAAVTYVTGFTPYWSDALLLVTRSGAPIFATALSKRVSEWIRTTDPISEIVNTPKPGTLIGERLAKDASIKRVGVLEFDMLPAGLADELAAAAPLIEWTDASAMFAGLRRDLDDGEHRLLARADAIAVAALAEAEQRKASHAGALVGLIEKSARLAGAEEIYVSLAPQLLTERRLTRVSDPIPLAGRFAVRASVAYKGCWVRRARTIARNEETADAELWFESLTRALQPGKPLGTQMASWVRGFPGAALHGWTAERCTGSYPLSAVDSSRAPGQEPLANGQFMVLTVELTLREAPWIGAAPLIVGRPSR